jgi:hypothetical protein
VPVVVAALVLAIALSVFALIRRGDVYREAVARAKASPAVQAELGSPIHEGWWILGHVRTRASTRSAALFVPLKGTKKNGTIRAVAHKSAGRWIYDRLEVEVEGRQERISLLVGEPVFKGGRGRNWKRSTSGRSPRPFPASRSRASRSARRSGSC